MLSEKSISTSMQSSQNQSDKLMVSHASTNQNAPGSPAKASSDTVTAVHKVIKDVERRRCNVVVSGLKPINNVLDDLLFKSLCERHFSILPLTIKSRRIDKISSSPGAKPSRLLVHLGSEAIASEVLAQARQLRHSDDEYVRLIVYVSRDMSPKKAKLAYEERTRRRQRKSNSLSEDSSKSLSRVDETNSSDILTSGVTSDPVQLVPVSTVTSVVPSLIDTMQFPPLDSHCSGAPPFQDKQPILNSSQWCPPGTTNQATAFINQPVSYVHHMPGGLPIVSSGMFNPSNFTSVVHLGTDACTHQSSSSSQANLPAGPFVLPAPAGPSVVHAYNPFQPPLAVMYANASGEQCRK